MSIDKSLSQYQHLLEGTTLGALRNAGIVDAPIQRNAISDPTQKIAMQTPKVENIRLPESQAIMPSGETSFQPAAKIKVAPPITNLLGQNQEGAGLSSFDSKRYNALAKNFYDQATAKKDNYLDQAVSGFLNRPVAAAADRGGATPLAPLAISSKTLAALPSEGEGEGEGGASYSDTQIQNILEGDDQDTKNFLTNTLTKTKNAIDNITKPEDLDKPGFFTKRTSDFLKSTVAKQLGISSLFGPLGMLFSWAFDKIASKIIGKDMRGTVNKFVDNTISKGKKDKDKTIKDKIKKQEEIWDKDDVDPADRGFTESGTYGGNPTYSSDGSKVDSSGDITNADGSHGGNILDEFVSTPAPAPAPTIDSDSGNGGGGGRSDDSWSSSPFLKGGRVKLTKGGRVDKALAGRNRDI